MDRYSVIPFFYNHGSKLQVVRKNKEKVLEMLILLMLYDKNASNSNEIK